jgi:hypothetical protein
MPFHYVLISIPYLLRRIVSAGMLCAITNAKDEDDEYYSAENEDGSKLIGVISEGTGA